MVNWIAENKDWLFSGLGVAVLTIIFETAKRKAGFKLTYQFYALLFVGVVLSFGVDYFVNFHGDWRLRIFLFGITIIATFLIDFIIQKLKQILTVKRAVKCLSIEDCKHVIDCYKTDIFVSFNMDLTYPLDGKWDKILYLRTGSKIALGEPYKVYVYEYAYKLARKKLGGDKK